MDKETKKFSIKSWKKGGYFKAGLTIFLVGLALIICHYYISHFGVVKAGFFCLVYIV